MKSGIVSFLLFLLFTLQAKTQQIRPITLSSEQNADKTYSIYADCDAYGDYTLKITFSTLTGYHASSMFNNVALITVSKGKREVLKLTPDKTATMYSFNYNYQYFAGRSLRRAPSDTGFLYLLPGIPSTSLRVLSVTNIKNGLGIKDNTQSYGTGFSYRLGDTICAVRAGTVYFCKDDIKVGEKGTEYYRSDRNGISIQHKDGTLGFYAFRAPIKLLVTPGDNVIPGQPLAVFNVETEIYATLFSIAYLDESKVLNPTTNVNEQNPIYYVSLPVHFYNSEDGVNNLPLTINKTFTVVHPKQLIGLELSKKEKKKLGL